MLGYGYKEDALKWRERQKELNDAELNKTAKMVCKVYLVDGSVLDYVLECTGRRYYWYSEESAVLKAEDGIVRIYNEECSAANKYGLHINGSFYPSAQIKRVHKGEIEVTYDA